ncbi:hypothetical protein FRB94_009483 [Tulasnella sp. JGI-2019a]|nr:hypothetical protein FRB93_008865 [Tulasnella sp. JGI-2019a]KAG8995073.1 hypothetical protein FRB94_009483 [Tulasnella sp. JGI-2019a]KAG9026326.1 hypothetical protein FRB95_008993 [Tulasnella sp. JGI-2019a]
MADQDAATVNLVGMTLSLSLWGFYTCLFLRTMRVMYQKRYSFFSPTSIIFILIFVFNLATTICSSVVAYRGFISYPGGANAYFTLYSNKAIDNGWDAASDFFLAACAFCADSLMLWRLFVVWARDKRIIIMPILLLAGGAIGCIFIVAYDVMAKTRILEPAFQKQAKALQIAVFAMNISTTWYLTIGIIYKLWYAERKSRVVHDYDVHSTSKNVSPYRRIIKLLIQSGMLYSMTEAAFLICIIVNNTNGVTVVDYMDPRIIGIVTSLLMLQIHTGGSSDKTSSGRIRNPTSHSVRVTTRVIKHTETIQHSDGQSDRELDAKVDPEQGIELGDGVRGNVQVSHVDFEDEAGSDTQPNSDVYRQWK